MDKVIERIKELNEDSRYAYADAITDAFFIGQVKALQKERNLNQEQLAALVGTKQSGISRWLNTGFATCKVETLRKFARAYGVRLRIAFEGFGSLPTDVNGFTKARLAPPRFEDDPAFAEPTAAPESEGALSTVSALQWLPSVSLGNQAGATALIRKTTSRPLTEQAAGAVQHRLPESSPGIPDRVGCIDQMLARSRRVGAKREETRSRHGSRRRKLANG